VPNAAAVPDWPAVAAGVAVPNVAAALGLAVVAAGVAVPNAAAAPDSPVAVPDRLAGVPVRVAAGAVHAPLDFADYALRRDRVYLVHLRGCLFRAVTPPSPPTLPLVSNIFRSSMTSFHLSRGESFTLGLSASGIPRPETNSRAVTALARETISFSG